MNYKTLDHPFAYNVDAFFSVISSTVVVLNLKTTPMHSTPQFEQVIQNSE